MTPIWSSALSLFWKTLRHTPSALTQPPIPVARSPPQVATSPAALCTANDGRHGLRDREPSGPTGQGAVQRAASDRPHQRTGEPRAAICVAMVAGCAQPPPGR